jgi:hypothetical protein
LLRPEKNIHSSPENAAALRKKWAAPEKISCDTKKNALTAGINVHERKKNVHSSRKKAHYKETINNFV